MRFVLAIAAVLMAMPAQARPWMCVLYPNTCEIPVVAPANPEPPLSQPAPIQPAPPVAVPAPHHKPAAKPHLRIKSNFAKPKRKTVSESGADLPWPCWQVRLSAWGKSEAALRAEGSARGINLTPKQERQARNCLARK